MKGDIILKIIINFLIPFILLYGCFSFTTYDIQGFSAFLDGFTLIIISIALYYIKYGKFKFKKTIPLKLLYMIIILLFLFYLIFILIRIVSI
jgi:hypothetical protein